MKNFIGAAVLLAIISLQPSSAQQPHWYPQQSPENYYINSPYREQNQGLQLSVNTPVNGSSFRGNFVLRGTGTPGAQVVVTGNMQGNTTVNRGGHWTMPMSLRGLAPGTVIHLTAFARDQFGNQSNSTQLKYAVSY